MVLHCPQFPEIVMDIPAAAAVTAVTIKYSYVWEGKLLCFLREKYLIQNIATSNICTSRYLSLLFCDGYETIAKFTDTLRAKNQQLQGEKSNE
jgi:hypothetical protein